MRRRSNFFFLFFCIWKPNNELNSPSINQHKERRKRHTVRTNQQRLHRTGFYGFFFAVLSQKYLLLVEHRMWTCKKWISKNKIQTNRTETEQKKKKILLRYAWSGSGTGVMVIKTHARRAANDWMSITPNLPERLREEHTKRFVRHSPHFSMTTQKCDKCINWWHIHLVTISCTNTASISTRKYT